MTSRASSEIAVASVYCRLGSHVEPSERLSGYDVVLLRSVAFWLLTCCSRATPCSASFHQPYCAMPSRGIAGDTLLFIWLAFSASVIRETRSAARSAGE